MIDSAKTSSYPLSEALTGRVINYLNVYRMIITVLLGAGYFTGAIGTRIAAENPAFAGAVLTAYLLFAAYHLFSASRPRSDTYRLAQYSMMTDVAFLALLLYSFGGLENGIGVLLIFASALAAVLLPLRLAMALASIAAVAMIGEATWRGYPAEGMEAVLKSGLYGVTAMLAALITHQLAYWARDYRLIAEKHQAAVSELEQVNELIIRRMSTGVIAVDQNCNVRVMNESAWFLLGSPPIRQRQLYDLSPRLEGSLIQWRKNQTVDYDPMLLEPSQARVVPSFVALPLGDEVGALIFLSDNNVIARRAMQMSVNSLAKLSSSIAHEIRNPLAAVTHAAQLLEESPTIKLPEMRLINIIQKQAKRMNGIVENILQLSRREQSRPEMVELNEFLLELIGEFLSTQSAKNIDFQTNIHPGDTHVVFDRSQLNQCLWKLLDNAVDHASDTRIPRVRLHMRRDENAGYCVITVEDNGPGIEKSQLKHIFEPFFTTRKEGSGLGLYIARQLCEANQSELTVDSVAGEGAQFHIRLALARGAPVRVESAAAELPEDAEEQAARAAP